MQVRYLYKQKEIRTTWKERKQFSNINNYESDVGCRNSFIKIISNRKYFKVETVVEASNGIDVKLTQRFFAACVDNSLLGKERERERDRERERERERGRERIMPVDTLYFRIARAVCRQ